MAEIDFGNFAFTRVTMGSLGGKFVIPSNIQTIKPNIPLRLTPKKEMLLKQHSRQHSKRHIDYMRQTMLLGVTFKNAHQRASQYIGR